jgi:hypothetical protein
VVAGRYGEDERKSKNNKHKRIKNDIGEIGGPHSGGHCGAAAAHSTGQEEREIKKEKRKDVK